MDKNKEIVSPRNYLKETIALQSQIEGAFLELGARLYRIRDEKLYEGEYESFDDFVITAKLSKATASKLITVYEKFVLEHNLPRKALASVGWSSLYTIAPYAGTKAKAIELVEKATLLTRADLEDSLRSEEDTHKHHNCKHTDTRLVRVCNECGQARQVVEK